MQIHSLQSTQATHSVSRSEQTQAAGRANTLSGPNPAAADELELSAEAQQISATQATGKADSLSGGIRTEKVAALRQAIANGTYETPENLSSALDKLLDTFA